MTTLILIMSFANFLFYPLVIGTIIAVIIEQIFRARGDGDNLLCYNCDKIIKLVGDNIHTLESMVQYLHKENAKSI